MKALASIMAGLCALDEGGSQPRIVNVIDASTLAPETSHLACGGLDDWEAIDAADRESILREVMNRHTLARSVANIEACLKGVSDRLQKQLLDEVEHLLISHSDPKQLEATLLRAPLRSAEQIGKLVGVCLSNGLSSTASILERVREAQPLLRSFADRWLSLPDDLFTALRGGRQRVWRLAIASGTILQTLDAPNYRAVEGAWVKIVFILSSPGERTALSRIAKAVAAAMFPDQSQLHAIQITPETETEEAREDRPGRPNAKATLDRVQRQIEAITAAVAQGYDTKAREYLRDLVAAQTAYSGGEEYAVKSLCNIAHQCAEMFRTDFEYECLLTAVDIKSTDGWTLIQLADHFKRVGRFEDAIETLQRAESLGEQRVARSTLADVYAHMGKFDDAIAIYESIPESDFDERIRGTKADVLRRWGRLEEAGQEYDRMIRDGVSRGRALAGKAEIAKREGRLAVAHELYLQVVQRIDLDASTSYVYRMATANVLLRMGRLGDAYNFIDECVQMRPFARQAKALRAAVAGLLGNPFNAIKDVPHLAQTRAFNEWVSEYVRGLLLLMLDRFGDARTALVLNLQTVEERLLDKDAEAMLRLGAAVCFLKERAGMNDAAQLLRDIPETRDAFTDAIRAAFQYHVAVALNQDAEIMRLGNELKRNEDDDLESLIAAISRRDWKNAWRLEIRALLRLAA